MDSKMTARLGAIVFVAIAVAAALLEVTRKPEEPPLYRSLPAFINQAPDPMHATLRQCRDMGEAAIREASCLKAWAENRDRFLGRDRTHPTVSSEGR